MTMQWMRNCRLTIQVDKNAPEALDFSDFKITFVVSQERPSSLRRPKFISIIYLIKL